MKFSILLFALLLSLISYSQNSDSLSLEEMLEYVDKSDNNSNESNGNAIVSTTPESLFTPTLVNPREISQKNGYEREGINLQRFDQKKWKEIVGDKDYSELQSRKKKKEKSKDSENSTQSRSSKNQRDKRDSQQDESDNSGEGGVSSAPINSPILTIIVYALAIGIIGYILFIILKNTSLKSKRKITKSTIADAAAPVIDIQELEIDRLLREALTAGNYKLAIRIYFLGLLKRLDHDGLIIWKKDKTNSDYLSELFSKDHYYSEIKSLTNSYEQVWYGDHTFSQQAYESIISSFKTIDQRLNTSRKGEEK
jgi:hypothetical protein